MLRLLCFSSRPCSRKCTSPVIWIKDPCASYVNKYCLVFISSADFYRFNVEKL
jgi:hypothetical protein